MVKNLPAMQETQVRSLGREYPLEKGMATHCGILAWRIPRTYEPGALQSIGLQRDGHVWATNTTTTTTKEPDTLVLPTSPSWTLRTAKWRSPPFAEEDTEAQSWQQPVSCRIHIWAPNSALITHALSGHHTPITGLVRWMCPPAAQTMGKKDMSASNNQPTMLLETNTTEVPAFHSEDFFG